MAVASLLVVVFLLVVVLLEVVVLVVVVVVRELLVVVVEVELEEEVGLLRQQDRELKHKHDNTCWWYCSLLLTWAKMATEWVQSGRLYEIHGIRMYVFDCLFLFVCADIESKNYTLNQFQYTLHYEKI